jgi:hypothetical protein
MTLLFQFYGARVDLYASSRDESSLLLTSHVVVATIISRVLEKMPPAIGPTIQA